MLDLNPYFFHSVISHDDMVIIKNGFHTFRGEDGVPMEQTSNTLGGGESATPGSPIQYPAWTKIVKLEDELLLSDFELSSKFVHIANIVEDTSTTRQTVIEFVPVISKADWSRKTEWIYIFTIDGHIVKIGGTRDGLKGRAGSYLCGHHISERGKSRDCSKTNGFLYNTFDHYVRNGHKVEMWGFEIPAVNVTVDIWGTSTPVRAQVYTAYETGALDVYCRQTKHYPALSDNSDPSHRIMKKSKRSPRK